LKGGFGKKRELLGGGKWALNETVAQGNSEKHFAELGKELVSRDTESGLNKRVGKPREEANARGEKKKYLRKEDRENTCALNPYE